jgi:hypothetical protein
VITDQAVDGAAVTCLAHTQTNKQESSNNTSKKATTTETRLRELRQRYDRINKYYQSSVNHPQNAQ